MYVCVHNESDLDLNINSFEGRGLKGKGKTFIDIAFSDDIIFSYEKGTYDEYVRFYRRVKTKNIVCSDLYVNLIDDKIVITDK